MISTFPMAPITWSGGNPCAAMKQSNQVDMSKSEGITIEFESANTFRHFSEKELKMSDY
jgi:organic radical activating enzyme